MKTCSHCKKAKPIESFNRHKTAKGGRYSWCKDCSKQDKLNRHAENPHIRRNRQLLKNYGISLEKFNEMYLKQGGLCAVCNTPETAVRDGKIMNLAVDHDHRTKKVRGLLCGACNTSLGLLRENETIISNLIKYLKNSPNAQ